MSLREGSLFTGYGGLSAAACEFFGARTVWTSDIDPGACKIIARRYPGVPNVGDITTIDWTRVEPVDILTGGSPCQDLSHAGKRAGMTEGTRSNLWVAMREAIAILRPRYVVWENVRGAYSAAADSDLESREGRVGASGQHGPVLRALGRVLGDLADIGYDARWVGLRAADVGAPHGRFRVFLLATHTAQHLGLAGSAQPGRREVPDGDGRSAGDNGVATNTKRLGRDGRPHDQIRGSVGGTAAAGSGAGTGATADASGQRHGRREDAGMVGQLDGGEESATRQRERARGIAGDRSATGCYRHRVSWGDYEPAIRRWERVLGRPALAPTETSARGAQRLSPRFVEWLMGLPEGWVTDVPGLSRNAQLKALGNGVVPQQALAALGLMDATEEDAA